MQIIGQKGHFLIEPILGIERDPPRVSGLERAVRPQRDRLPRKGRRWLLLYIRLTRYSSKKSSGTSKVCPQWGQFTWYFGISDILIR